MFKDRKEAGSRLAERLIRFKDRQPVILGLPRGGVAVAYEIAEALEAPLDLILVRKIGVPWQPELAVGAVVDGQQAEIVVNDEVATALDLPEDYLKEESRRQLQEIERRRRLYLGDRPPVPISGRTAIVVDDGIATGATMRAALIAIRRQKPSRLVLAVPVAPPETLEALTREVDEIVCLAAPAFFGAIGAHYRDFHQLEDDEVIALLKDAARFAEHPKHPG